MSDLLFLIHPFSKKNKPLKAVILSIFLFTFLVFNLNQKSLAQIQTTSSPTDTIIKDPNAVEIIYAEVFEGNSINGITTRFLKTNVMIRHKDLYLECDSAVNIVEKKSIRAFHNVYILQQPCTHIYCDSLYYDGNTRDVTLMGNVLLTDDKMQLSCKGLKYNLNTRIGTYTNGGQLTQNGSVLTSKKGYYYGKTNDVVFKGDVVLVNPEYNMFTDTLKYNLDKEIAYFRGKTTIEQDKSSIYCEKGYYDTKNKYALFGKHTYLSNPPYELYADTMKYDQKRGIGTAYKNVYWKDNQNGMSIKCFHGIYNEKTGKINCNRQALLTYLQDNDTLYLNADTIVSTLLDTIQRKRTFSAYRAVKLFRKDLQARCDSLQYSQIDSVFRLYKNPYTWNDSVQLKGDTIYIYTEDNSPKEAQLRNNAFIITKQKYPDLYDQIKGDNIYAYFKDKKMVKLLDKGNAECIYFAKDDANKYIGVNQSKASYITFHLKDSKVDKIIFVEQPEATFYTIQKNDPKKFILQGFEYREDLRPKTVAEMIDRKYF